MTSQAYSTYGPLFDLMGGLGGCRNVVGGISLEGSKGWDRIWPEMTSDGWVG